MQKLMIVAGAALVALSVGTSAHAASSKPRSAISLECSKEADAKGLHGHKRKAFREHCKREAEHASGYTSKKKYGSKKYDSMKGYRSTDKSMKSMDKPANPY
jgi:hypothetical protein